VRKVLLVLLAALAAVLGLGSLLLCERRESRRDIEQCRNGSFAAPQQCTAPRADGNAGASNSHYREATRCPSAPS
jgi:hypothetical protein